MVKSKFPQLYCLQLIDYDLNDDHYFYASSAGVEAKGLDGFKAKCDELMPRAAKMALEEGEKLHQLVYMESILTMLISLLQENGYRAVHPQRRIIRSVRLYPHHPPIQEWAAWATYIAKEPTYQLLGDIAPKITAHNMRTEKELEKDSN